MNRKALTANGTSRWRFSYLFHTIHGRISIENVREEAHRGVTENYNDKADAFVGFGRTIADMEAFFIG